LPVIAPTNGANADVSMAGSALLFIRLAI